MAREIKLTRGAVAIVDDDCFSWLAGWNWSADTSRGHVYAYRGAVGGNSRTTVYLHRVVAGAGGGEVVDHVNGDTLDNRRCNLRICTPSQNAMNARKPPSSSGYRGVFKCGEKWRVRIDANGKSHAIGRFTDKIEAAHAYDAAARKVHGAFAILNFPEAQHD